LFPKHYAARELEAPKAQIEHFVNQHECHAAIMNSNIHMIMIQPALVVQNKTAVAVVPQAVIP